MTKSLHRHGREFYFREKNNPKDRRRLFVFKDAEGGAAEEGWGISRAWRVSLEGSSDDFNPLGGGGYSTKMKEKLKAQTSHAGSSRGGESLRVGTNDGGKVGGGDVTVGTSY